MRYTTSITFSALLTAINALTITSPSAGSTVDVTKPITITWTSTSSDPSTINLVFTTSPGSTFTSMDLGSNIQTSSGSFTVPANTISAYGADFGIEATSPSGDNVGSATGLILSFGSGVEATTVNGQATYVPTATTATAAAASLSSITFDTSGLSGQSVTATYLPSTDITATAGVTGNSTLSSTSASTLVTSTSSGSSSSSSSTTRTSSGTSSASAESASNTSNAQVKVGVAREVMGFAGVLAGLVALVA